MEFVIKLLGIGLIAFWIYRLCKSAWSFSDHASVGANSKLQPNATIVDVNTEKVQYTKNDAKYKTTVSFSDGFTFITHLSDREGYLTRYQISMSPKLYEQIISNAIEAHNRALEKQKYY